MLEFLKKIIKTNKELILLMFFFPTLLIILNSHFFFPIITSIILSYLLYNIKTILENLGINEKTAFILTYMFFLTIFFSILFVIFPIFFKQLLGLFNDLPIMIQKIKILTYDLVNKYPFIFPQEQTNIIFSNIIAYFQSIGKTVISASLISIVLIVKWILYICLIPIFVFFFLKDHLKIKFWFKHIMPEKSTFLEKVWQETNPQIINYIRGKFIEIIIIAIINYLLFNFYKLSYADLLAFIVGLSVIIPYVGIIVISVPIIFISAVQYGLSYDFFYLTTIYSIIHILDGNLLVPILFSETVNLHPISIMFSIIIFGYIFGLYGIFFAIPLAIVSKAIINLYLTPDFKK